jgi:hypothetical protein
MEGLLIIFGAIVVFCIGFLLGMNIGKSDSIIINMK